jgi:hypothetical protein
MKLCQHVVGVGLRSDRLEDAYYSQRPIACRQLTAPALHSFVDVVVRWKRVHKRFAALVSRSVHG